MKFVLFIIALSISLLSCRKELSFEDPSGGKSTYYIRCRINGADREFTYSLIARTVGYEAQDSVLNMKGASSSDVHAQESIDLNIYFSDLTPGPGAYTEGYTGADYRFITGIYDADSANFTYNAGYASLSDYPLQIVISERTETEISGTFEGAFYVSDIDDGEIHPEFLSITDGTFRLKVQH